MPTFQSSDVELLASFGELKTMYILRRLERKMDDRTRKDRMRNAMRKYTARRWRRLKIVGVIVCTIVFVAYMITGARILKAVSIVLGE